MTNIEHDYDDNESNNNQANFVEININKIETNQLRSDTIGNMYNNPSNECINHSFYLVISNNLFNNMKNNNQLSRLFVGVLLELKKVINLIIKIYSRI